MKPRAEKRSPRILYMIDSMHGGGAERQAIELVQALCNRYVVVLGLLNKRGPLLDDVPDAVNVVSLEGCAGWRRALHGGRKLWKIVDRYRPDVIISSLVESNRLLARTSPFLPGDPKVVLTVQNNLSLKMHERSLLSRFFDKVEVPLLYNLADRIIAVSEGVKTSLSDNYAIPTSRVDVIHNMVNIDRVQKEARVPAVLPWESDASYPILVAVGRMVPQKAFDELIQGFSILRQNRSARLVLLGDGPLYEDLEAQVSRLGLTSDVYMPGFVDNPWSYMQEADIFVSSSHWEGFSLAHLEAMVCGCVPVLTDCNFGPRELIDDGVNGRLAPVGEPGALAVMIGNLLDNSQELEQIVQNAQSCVRSYDRSSIVAQYEDLLDDLLNEPGRMVRSGTKRELAPNTSST